MMSTTHVPAAPPGAAGQSTAHVLARTFVIGLIAFLTLVDLFATQAILPSLARHYAVSPAAMGFAVNASTMGMAIAGLGVAFFSRRIDGESSPRSRSSRSRPRFSPWRPI
jgi:MFS family permease